MNILQLKILKEPIIDASLEIRFKSLKPEDAIFGLIYGSLSNEFPKVERLPITRIPEQIRLEDSKFKFKPFMRISNENFVVQIGYDVITIASYPKYSGWAGFKSKIIEVLNKLHKLGIISEIFRIGLRYINFFEDDIYDNINLNINFNNGKISNQNTMLKTEFINNGFTSVLQVINNVELENIGYGSIIDIDTSIEANYTEINGSIFANIEEAHRIEKELFFSVLNENYIKALYPEYRNENSAKN